MSYSLPPLRLLPEWIVSTYNASQRRLLLFDYDGTLTPIVPDPASAVLSAETSHQLNILANNPKNEVWVISGRGCAFLDEHVGKVCPKLGLCAEHGAFIRYPQGIYWRDFAASEDWTWCPYIAAGFEVLVREMPGSVLERKQAALAWHFRQAVADPQAVANRAKEAAQKIRVLLRDRGWKVDVVEGKCVIEVRARGLNKGWVLEELISKAKDEWDFVACWGDDTTDEDMFQELARSDLAKDRAFSVKVGDDRVETSAKYIVAAPADVRKCIEWLNET